MRSSGSCRRGCSLRPSPHRPRSEAGCRSCPHRGRYTKRRSRGSRDRRLPSVRRRPTLVKQLGAQIEDRAGENGIQIAAVAVAGPRENRNGAHAGDELFDERRPDNLHRELVRAVLEGAIYEVARRLVHGGLPTPPSVWLDVRLPTRVKPLHLLANTGDENRYRTMLWEDLGIETRDEGGAGRREEMVHFMDEGAARALVEEVVQHYTESTFRPVSRVAVAVRLNASAAPRPPDWRVSPFRARFLHYVADALLAEPGNVPDAWWSRGFVKPEVVEWRWRMPRTREIRRAATLPKDVDGSRSRARPVYEWTSRHDERLRSLLRAQRHLLAGGTPEAFADGIGHENGKDGSLELRIQQRLLREALSTLNGSDVQTLRRLQSARRRT